MVNEKQPAQVVRTDGFGPLLLIGYRLPMTRAMVSERQPAQVFRADGFGSLLLIGY
jgi:hypothetical protein